VIDLEQLSKGLNFIEFSGYDLDGQSMVSSRIDFQGRIAGNTFEPGRAFIDVTDKMTVQTSYKAILNVSQNGVRFVPATMEVVLATATRTVARIPVIRANKPACKTEVITHTPTPVTFVPPHKSGDGDFTGNGPAVVATAELWSTDGEVKAHLYMSAAEVGGDKTVVEGTRDETLYTVKSGWVIRKVLSATESEVAYTDRDANDDVFEGGNGPVSRWTFMGDNAGIDVGRTRVTANFNPLRIELVQVADCGYPP
jgi:hypothetical protein